MKNVIFALLASATLGGVIAILRESERANKKASK